MSFRKLLIASALLASAIALLFLPAGRALSDGLTQVIVTNWPEQWKIYGEVKVPEPVKLARLDALRDIIVAPVQPTETTRLVDAGTIVSDGFPSVVLGIHGFVKGSVKRPGVVGVILLPDEPTIQEAFQEQGLLHFAHETVSTEIDLRTVYFASGQPRYTLGFPRYRVLLYNTTDKTVTANIFAYLTQ